MDAILVGRIAQQNENILIGVELVDAREKTQVWGRQYDRQRSDLSRYQAQELTGRCGAKLRLMAKRIRSGLRGGCWEYRSL